MKSVIISLLLLGNCLLTSGQVTCDDVFFPNCDEADPEYTCIQYFEGCIEDPETDFEFTTTTTTTTPIDSTTTGVDTTDANNGCSDDRDAHNWRLDYIGKSTQFRLHDPCDNDWIKFKMEDLTEYDSDGKKTTNKETAFASADWRWGNSGGNTQWNGYNAIVNQYNATELTKMDASLLFTTIFFTEDAVFNGENITRNSLKFAVEIENWEYIDDGNYIEMCFDIMTKHSGDGFAEDAVTGDLLFNGFTVSNDDTASCEGASDMDVITEYSGNLKNHLTLCYTFPDTCDSGNIYYDPLVGIVIAGDDRILNDEDRLSMNSSFSTDSDSDSGSDSDPDKQSNGSVKVEYYSVMIVFVMSAVYII